MKFWKAILALLLSTLYFVLGTGSANAENEFSVDASVTYKVQDSGKTLVSHNVTLENNFSTLYATTYTLSLENIDAQNIQAFNSKGVAYNVETQKSGEKTDIKITFPDAVTGKGAKRNFTVAYENGSFAVRTGEVWEISIPRLSGNSSFRNYTINLLVPDSFGLEAYISPVAKSSIDANGYKSYVFGKNQVAATGITAGFGQFQVFSFNLSYHLENPLGNSAQTQIALPPDTAFQKVYIQKLEPKPANVNVDEDGNWLALYKLSPRQRVDVIVSGSVQIFAGFRPFPKPSKQTLNDNLQASTYWQSGDSQIKSLSSTYSNAKDIYDFVSSNLKYDYSRVQPNVQRMGAIKALQNPASAICMEFTDLFIALARANGIPAREINGYAYTENPQIQPLSLVADVLHAWPEYYDKDKGAWIPVDPTWGATSGIDYFNKLDLRHFAFVIHGKDDTKPYPPGSYKLGPNPQKDVYVSFGKLPAKRLSTPKITAEMTKPFPFINSLVKVKIFNPGPEALYSLYPTVYFDGKQESRDFIEVLPPFATSELEIKIPFSLLGKDTPGIVKVALVDTSVEIATNKSQVIISSLLIVLIVIISLVIWVLVRLKKINLNPIFAKIRTLGAKINGIIRKIGKTDSREKTS